MAALELTSQKYFKELDMGNKNRAMLYVSFLSIFLSACGGGGSSSGVEVGTAERETYSTNVSGVWSGTAEMLGELDEVVVTVTVHQAVSDSVESPAQALTGTVTFNGGAPGTVTGTKDGDAWSVSGAADGAIGSIDQTLLSATKSSGTISYTAEGSTVTAGLNLTKI